MYRQKVVTRWVLQMLQDFKDVNKTKNINSTKYKSIIIIITTIITISSPPSHHHYHHGYRCHRYVRQSCKRWFSVHFTQTVLIATLDAIWDKSSAVAEMGDRGHNRHGPKRGGAVPLSRELGPRLVQCGLGRGLLPYQVASSSIQPFGHNKHGPKLGGGGCALFSGVAGSTSNTMLRRPRPTSLPSGILIHAAVWPQ